MPNLISTLVCEDIKGYAFRGTVAAPNGSIYGVPYKWSNARRVVKFHPVNKSITHIGPDLGINGYRFMRGDMTDSGVIYCPPDHWNRGILKIDTNTDTVTELNRNFLPAQGLYSMWASCATALDGCIYFMPYNARCIMKLDPNNGDAMSSVGDVLGDGYGMYTGTFVGIDGCVYGIPYNSKRIIKYDPINDITSFVGEEADTNFKCEGNGALGRDGCIYVIIPYRKILKIDTTNNSHCFIGNCVESDYYRCSDAILGIDGCIYWPPAYTRRILKYDPHANKTSLVGDDYGYSSSQHKWFAGSLASDGVIYCFPAGAERIMCIDPWKEFLMTVKKNIEEYPQNFGFLFERTVQMESFTLSRHQPNIDHHAAPRKCTNCYNAIIKFVQKMGIKKSALEPATAGFEQHNTKPPLHHVSRINFDHAVVKFGQEKVIAVLEKHMGPVHDFCKCSNFCPFMIVASYQESSVGAIYHFLRQDLSWVNGFGSPKL